MQVCTSLQTDNQASTPPLSFFAGRMPFLPPNRQRQSTEGNCVLILWFSYVGNSLHFNLADFRLSFINEFVSRFCWYLYRLHFAKNIAYHIPEMLIVYADKVFLMGHSGNSHVFNFMILLKSQKSWKLDAHEIFTFHGTFLSSFSLLSASISLRTLWLMAYQSWLLLHLNCYICFLYFLCFVRKTLLSYSD